jgi:hypothetical protein|tara:strand:- start:691 stop:813 length:123 start_codon:yes stop_codon:yes gene_type:complete
MYIDDRLMSIEIVKSIIDLFFTGLFIKEIVIIEMNKFLIA